MSHSFGRISHFGSKKLRSSEVILKISRTIDGGIQLQATSLMETLNSGALKVAQAGKTLLLLALYPKEIFETALHEDTFVKSDEEEDIRNKKYEYEYEVHYVSEIHPNTKYNRGRARFFRLVGDRLYYWARKEDAQLCAPRGSYSLLDLAEVEAAAR